jgi:predicted nuclease with TOPRIM domain
MSLEQLEAEYEKTQKARESLEKELNMLRSDFQLLEDKYVKDIAELQKRENELHQKLIDAENPSSESESDSTVDLAKEEEVQDPKKVRLEAEALREVLGHSSPGRKEGSERHG